jgi:hypothetical protein
VISIPIVPSKNSFRGSHAASCRELRSSDRGRKLRRPGSGQNGGDARRLYGRGSVAADAYFAKLSASTGWKIKYPAL